MAYRHWVTGCCIGLAAWANAQAPDVRVKLDAIVSMTTSEEDANHVRLYDPLGNRGVLAVTFYLEPGFRTYVTQRLQPIENDPDTGPLDEYYVEDEGLWRVGKQYLPFGTGQIMRESVVAVRGDTNLIFESLPIAVSACDGGPGRQRGFVGRIGSRIGVSFAIGHHFGIGASALDYIRRPEEAPGVNRGYERVLGVDGRRTLGRVTVVGEAVFLRRGETPLDVDEDVLDGSLTFQPVRQASITVGATRSQAQDRVFLRLGMGIDLDRHSTLQPLFRVANGRLYDASLTLRVRF